MIKSDEEVRQQMEKDALFHKYFTKSNEGGAKGAFDEDAR